MKALDNKLVDFANSIIDQMCEDDVYDTIQTLIGTYDFTKEELAQMGFSAHDIEDALEDVE